MSSFTLWLDTGRCQMHGQGIKHDPPPSDGPDHVRPDHGSAGRCQSHELVREIEGTLSEILQFLHFPLRPWEAWERNENNKSRKV